MFPRIAASHPDRGGRQVQRPGSPGAEGLSGGDRSHARPGEAPGRRRRRRGSQSERPGCGHRGRWEKVGREARVPDDDFAGLCTEKGDVSPHRS